MIDIRMLTQCNCRIVNESSWKFTWLQSRWPVIRVNENRAYVVARISLKTMTAVGIVARVSTSTDGAFASARRPAVMTSSDDKDDVSWFDAH